MRSGSLGLFDDLELEAACAVPASDTSHSCCQVAPSGARHTLSETLSKTAPAPSAKAETKLSLGSGRPLTDFQKSRHRPRIGDRKSGKKKGRSRQGRATARMFRDPPAIHWLLRNPKGSLSQHIRRFALPTARRPSYRSHDRLDHYASYWRADVETLNQFIHSLLARRPDSGIPAIACHRLEPRSLSGRPVWT